MACLRTTAAMRTTQSEREEGKTLVASSPIPEARQRLVGIGTAADCDHRGGSDFLCSTRSERATVAADRARGSARFGSGERCT